MRYSEIPSGTGGADPLKIAAILCGAVFLMLLFFLIFGLPRVVKNALLQSVSLGGFVLDAEAMNIMAKDRRIDLRGIKVHQKGIIGPAFFQAEELDVTVPLSGVLLGKPRVRNIVARGVSVHPLFLKPASPAKQTTIAATPLSSVINFAIYRAQIDTIHFSSLKGQLHISGDNFSLEGLDAELDERNAITGNITYEASMRRIEINLVSELDGSNVTDLLCAIFGPGIRDTLSPGLHKARVGLRTSGRVLLNDTLESVISLEIAGEHINIRGIPLRRLTLDGLLRWGPDGLSVHIDHLVGSHAQGLVEGEIHTDLAAQTIWFNGQWGIDIITFLNMAGRRWPAFLREMEFPGRSAGSGQGVLGIGSGMRDSVNGRLFFEQLNFHELRLQNATCHVHVSGYTNHISDLTGSLWDGTLKADLTVYPSLSGPMLALHAELDGADVRHSLEQLNITVPPDLHGTVAALVDWQSPVGEGWQAGTKASGRVWVTKGRIFTLPLFGGMTEILTDFVPGVDLMLSQSDLYVRFSIDGNKIRVPELKIEGGWIVLDAHGSIDIAMRALDMRARVNLLRGTNIASQILRTLTYPVSRLLEFSITGPIDSPNWYPVNLSTDLLRELGF